MDNDRTTHSNPNKLPLQRPLHITLPLPRRHVLVLNTTQQQQRHARRGPLQRLALQHHHLAHRERQPHSSAQARGAAQAHRPALPDDDRRAGGLARPRRDLRAGGRPALRVGGPGGRGRRAAVRHVAGGREPDVRGLRAGLGGAGGRRVWRGGWRADLGGRGVWRARRRRPLVREAWRGWWGGGWSGVGVVFWARCAGLAAGGLGG